MKKSIIILALSFLTVNLFAFKLDFDLPLKIEFARSEAELNYSYSGTKFLDMPLPEIGPLRATYVFEPENSRWSFGAGLSSYIYPFFTFSGSGTASYRLCSFENGSKLFLENVLDLGLFAKSSEYYDTTLEKRTTKIFCSPFAEYSILLVYQFSEEKPLNFGMGPSIAVASMNKKICAYYGLNCTLGLTLDF